jgi:hypothetical protein
VFGINKWRVSSVTKQQAVGFLLKTLLGSCFIFLIGCSSHPGPVNKNIIVHSNHKHIDSTYMMAWKIFEDMKWNLPYHSTRLHNQSVVMAVKRAQNGQMVEWFDEKNGAMGYTKILITHPISGGYCRQAETKVQFNGNKRTWIYKACTIDEGASFNIEITG